jgi:hypothetical protein
MKMPATAPHTAAKIADRVFAQLAVTFRKFAVRNTVINVFVPTIRKAGNYSIV